MDFNHFTDKVDTFKLKELGGQKAQFKLVPKIRLEFSNEKIKSSNPTKAAVLALFYPDEQNQTRFLLTQRASYKGTHSAQISFPGGKTNQSDLNLKNTALRETNEEIGIAENAVKIIRELTTTYIPPSNFIVSPFLGILEQTPIFKTNYEVASTIEVLLDDLLNDQNISSKIMSTSYMKDIEVPCFKLNDYVVWGATAMILSEIKDLIKL